MLKTACWKWQGMIKVLVFIPSEPGEREKENSGESGICLSVVKRSELCRDLNFTNE